jgi:hypothetical protein
LKLRLNESYINTIRRIYDLEGVEQAAPLILGGLRGKIAAASPLSQFPLAPLLPTKHVGR